ncbi:hypothetical protein HETIRDRAFT_115725 [Heterobasidion irregulare TC 32-1]|uniref:Early meiotic induction protein 1 n=1 Tax=Heterobasidion irregulare (strain TC 32-1) TaxID=747525 RepID=W4K3G4_HETIT|nr:uncharacterized protein HETIRDRAFT_115725 [Heterobasidion irregulare TC 32-1]ETW80347.1 hypothetical protein HETIRDRAFT_115725 [Heterobasidion irregulare TC 32-1]
MSESTQAFRAVVQQEEARLQKEFPTPEDIPTCMTLFDEFLRCNVVGSQFKSLYRYGEMAKCTPKMDEFKYCMSIKSLHPEEKRAEWIRHRAEYWARKRLTMSSENVWEVRTEPLQNYPPPPNFTVVVDSSTAIH